jgi:hypothetical protein
MAEVVEQLPSRLKTLSSNPSTNKKKIILKNCIYLWYTTFFSNICIHCGLAKSIYLTLTA